MSTSGNATAGIPALLTGAAQSMMNPSAAAAVPQLGPSMASAIPGGGGGIADLLQGALPGPGMKPAAGMIEGGPQAALKAMVPTGIPPVEAQPAWKQALSAAATVQDMGLKNQQANRMQNAPSPNFYIPGNVQKPQLGKPVAATQTPLQRFAMLLRS
jgi:hypothetical protein